MPPAKARRRKGRRRGGEFVCEWQSFLANFAPFEKSFDSIFAPFAFFAAILLCCDCRNGNCCSDLLRLLLQLSQQRFHFLWNCIHRILFDADVEIDHGEIFSQHTLGLFAIGDRSDAVANHLA